MKPLLLLLLSCCLLACQPDAERSAAQQQAEAKLQTGAEQLQQYLPLLQGKRVGVLVNQTSLVGGQHLVDVLLANQVNIVSIFAPEHGFRGDYDAGASVKNSTDSKTGLQLLSLYGASKKPSAEQMQQLDVVVFDILVNTSHDFIDVYNAVFKVLYKRRIRAIQKVNRHGGIM